LTFLAPFFLIIDQAIVCLNIRRQRAGGQGIEVSGEKME
jgi:hypothetical protein